MRPFHARKSKKVARFKVVDRSLLFLEVWITGSRAVVRRVSSHLSGDSFIRRFGGSLVRELGVRVRVRVRVRQSRQVVVRRHRGGTEPRTSEPPDK